MQIRLIRATRAAYLHSSTNRLTEVYLVSSAVEAAVSRRSPSAGALLGAGANSKQLDWDGIPAGVFFIRLVTVDGSALMKVMVR